MYRPSVSITVLYGIFAVFYYGVSTLIFFQDHKDGSNILQKLLIALGDMFFWITVHAYFFIAIVLSSIIGMIYCRIKGFPTSFKVFRNICIGTIVLAGILVILSNL